MTEERHNNTNINNTHFTWNLPDNKAKKPSLTTINFLRSSSKNRSTFRKSTRKFSMRSSSSHIRNSQNSHDRDFDHDQERDRDNDHSHERHPSTTLSLIKETPTYKKIYNTKNTITCKERKVIKQDMQNHANSLNRQGYTGFINAINTIVPPMQNIKSLSSKPQQITLKKLMSTRLIDILPPKVKYSKSYHLSLDQHYIKADKINKNLSTYDTMNSRNLSFSNKTGSNERKTIKVSPSTDSILNKLQTTKMVFKPLVVRDDFLKKLLSLNSDMTRNLQLLFKMKSIRWLWKKKAVLLTKIIGSFYSHRWFFNKYEFMARDKFEELLQLIQMGRDDEFIDLLYLVFAQNKSKMIDVKECLFFFIFFSCYEYERKWRTMLDVMEVPTPSSSSLPSVENHKEMIHLYRLQCYFRTALEKADFMFVLHCFKKYMNDNELIEKNEIYTAMVNSSIMKNVFKESYSMMMHVDNRLDEEVESTMNVNSKQQFTFMMTSSIKSYIPAFYQQLGRIVESTEKAIKLKAKMERLNEGEGIEECTDSNREA